jgi:hypothetical protein
MSLTFEDIVTVDTSVGFALLQKITRGDYYGRALSRCFKEKLEFSEFQKLGTISSITKDQSLLIDEKCSNLRASEVTIQAKWEASMIN